MSLATSRRMFFPCSSYTVAFLVVLVVLQIWVCCDSCRAGAIRVFPENGEHVAELRRDVTEKVLMSREEVFHKYFKRYINGFNKTDEKGFDESKRKVPSCPDPLHN